MNHSPGISGTSLNENQGQSPHFPLRIDHPQQQSSPRMEVNSNAHLRERAVQTQVLSTGLIIQKQAGLGSTSYTIQSSALCQVIPAAIMSKEFKRIQTSFASFSPHSLFLPNKKCSWNNLLPPSIISTSHPFLIASTFISAIIVQIGPIK